MLRPLSPVALTEPHLPELLPLQLGREAESHPRPATRAPGRRRPKHLSILVPDATADLGPSICTAASRRRWQAQQFAALGDCGHSQLRQSDFRRWFGSIQDTPQRGPDEPLARLRDSIMQDPLDGIRDDAMCHLECARAISSNPCKMDEPSDGPLSMMIGPTRLPRENVWTDPVVTSAAGVPAGSTCADLHKRPRTAGDPRRGAAGLRMRKRVGAIPGSPRQRKRPVLAPLVPGML